MIGGLGATAAAALLPFGAGRPARAAGPPMMVDRWTDDHCLTHNGINMWWAKECEFLPCFPGVSFPGYAERLYEGKMKDQDGKLVDVIIHAWKGYCRKFEDNAMSAAILTNSLIGIIAAARLKNHTPGGMGAEVGIYRRRDLGWVERHKQRIDSQSSLWKGRVGALVFAQGFQTVTHLGQTWYPAPELKKTINFRLLDPQNRNAVVIDTRDRYRHINLPRNQRPEEYYWCTEWLDEESYQRWWKHRPQYHGVEIEDPTSSVELTLEFEISGMSQKVVWAYEGPNEKICQPNVGCPVLPVFHPLPA